MNRSHSIIWSACRKSFVVAGENVKTKGKPCSFTNKAIASTVLMALSALAATPALAVPPPGQTWTTDIVNPIGSSITGTNDGIRANANSNFTGSITNSGTITGGVYGIVIGSSSTITGSITNSGTISGGTKGIFIDSSSSITGSITNSGSISGGTFAVHFNSSSFTGNITNSGTISGGINIDNSPGIGGIFNLSGGLIDGYLNIGGNNVNISNAGTIAPRTGMNSITSNYTQTSAGTNNGLSIGVTDQANHARLYIIGTATFNSDAHIYVNVVNPGTALAGASLTNAIVTATAGVTATTFSVKSNSTSNLFTASIIGNDIVLSYTACACTASNFGGTISFGGTNFLSAVNAAGSAYEKGAASVFDTLSAATGELGTAYNRLSLMTTPQEQSDAIKQTLPLMTGSMTQATTSNLRRVDSAVQERMQQNGGLNSGDGFVSDNKVWLKPLGSWADQKDVNGISGYKMHTSGVIMGADGALSPAARIGAAFAISRSNVDNNLGTQAAKVDSYQVVLYGLRNLDERTAFNWVADYGYNRNKSNRNINFMALTAAANFISDSVHFGAGLDHTFIMNETTRFTPSVRADYTSIHNSAYAETGAGGLNLALKGQTTDALVLTLGGKVSHKLSDTSRLTANLGLAYDTQAKASTITAAFAGGGAAFTTQGISPAPTTLLGGVEYAMNTSKAMEVSARYDIEAKTGFTAQTASVKLRLPF